MIPVGHTEGPWEAKWSKYREGEFIVQAAFPSNRVLAVFDGDGDGPDAQEIASAHLIAAAPDLLAVVEAFIGKLGKGGYSPDAGKPLTDKMRAALAKARGETS